MDTKSLSARISRRMAGRIGLALFGALTVASLAATSLSLALFTDSQAAGANAFTTGTISLGLNPTSAIFSSGAMMPGDNANGTLVVSNSGTAQLRYAVTSSSTNTDGKGLNAQLTVTIKTLGTSCAAFDGTSLYSGALSAAAFGDPTAGAQTGDRTLAAAASETLCFRASLPSGTGNAFQGATTTATFTFQAEQTANNP
jgi:camelysin-like metallo-endopeptidase